MARQRLSFAFVCQPGELELKAMLLAASLRVHATCDCEVVAGVPAGQVPQLRRGARELFGRLDVRVREIANPLDAGYPIGNKLACTAIPTDAQRRIFLDSDVVMLRPLGEEPAWMQGCFAARIASRLPADEGLEQLELAFAAAGTRLDVRRHPNCHGVEFPPYFNAGFIMVDPRIGFAEAWTECCCAIERSREVTCKRPWLDQLGLAAAVSKMRLEYGIVGNEYNWPRVLPLPADELPFFYHYGPLETLLQDDRTRYALEDLVGRFGELSCVCERLNLSAKPTSIRDRIASWFRPGTRENGESQSVRV